eukprot:gene7540-10274_t
MSAALVWHLIRDNNSFLTKRGQTNRSGAVQFSSEPGNLLGVNTYKYSGLANEKTISISKDLDLVTKAPLSNKPKTSTKTEKLGLHTVKSLNKLIALSQSSYRSDLSSAARLRYEKLKRDALIRKGISKKVVKSTKRGKK